MPPKQNSKQVAGNARKAESEAAKQQKLAQQQELDAQKEWAQGSNQRGAAKLDAAAVKEAEAARKRAEKERLLKEEEEEEMGGGGAASVKVKKVPAVKKKHKNDLGLLDSFVSEAEQKAKAKKKADAVKKEKEEALLAQKRAEKEAIVVDPLLLNTESMLAGAVGRTANKEAMQEQAAASGIDSALDFMSITGGVEIKSRKALYMAFEERTMAEVKADYPGLRLTQYKEKIFALWKKSPENPENQLEKKM